MEAGFKDKRLLIIGNSYYAGHKDWANAIAGYFSHNYYFVKYNSFFRFLNSIPIPFFQNSFRRFDTEVLMNQTGKPGNLEIFPVDVKYLPFESQVLKLGERQSKKVLEAIQRYGLRFDLIHTHFLWPQGFSGARVKDVYGVPLVVTAHGYDVYDLPFRNDLWREKIEFVLNQADQIITVSQNNFKCLQKLDVETPVAVLSNGFDSQKFHLRNMEESRRVLNLPPEKKILLMIGNFGKIKGHIYLISAIEKIVQERNDLLCVFIGDGKLRKKIVNLVDRKNLESYFHFVGQTPHTQIPIWMSASDIIVLPSLFEGNPYVMFEALGSGKPFLGSRVGGIPDVIISDDYGYIMEPGDVDDIANCIVKALDRRWDPERITRYASQFAWERIAQETGDLYRTVLDGRRA